MAPKKKSIRKSRQRQALQQPVTLTETTAITSQQQTTSTETINVVSQQQSQEIAQSLLLSSVVMPLVNADLSAILYSRELIGEKSFKKARFDMNTEAPWSYELLKTGAMEVKDDDCTQSLLLLQNDGTDKARAFMEYIETGAFEAIEKGYLRAFQLRIFEDIDHPENILEIYTLNFSYHRPISSNPDGRSVSGIEVTGPQGRRASLNNVRIGFVEFMRKLTDFLRKLPELPNKRYFKPKFLYTDECPPGYQPHGFKEGTAHVLHFPRAEGLVKRTAQAGNYQGGHHSVNMIAEHLQWSGTRDDPIPTGLQYDAPALPTTDAESGSRPSEHLNLLPPLEPHDDRNQIVESSASRSSMLGAMSSPRKRKINDLIPKSAAQSVAPRTSSKQSQYQDHSQDTVPLGADSQDRRERAVLKRMRQESNYENEDTQLVQPDEQPHASGDFEEPVRMRLVQNKVNQLDEKMQLVQQYGLNLNPTRMDEDTVTCQCGWPGEEDDNMVCCEWCKTWQHCSCYGYRGASDPRIPQQHACYRCLFDGDDYEARKTLRELCNFTLLRRGIHVIEKSGYHDISSFATALGTRDRQTASETFKALLSEGAVVASAGSKSNGFTQTRKPRYEVVSQEPDFSEMIRKFFDPWYKIKQYYVAGRREQASAGLSRGSKRVSDRVSSKEKQHSMPEQDPETSRRYSLRNRWTPKRGNQVETPLAVRHVHDGSPMGFFSRGMSAE